MTKTRSQTRTISIKEEEDSETELKNTQLLNSANTITTKIRGKIAKRRAPEKHDSVKKGNHSLSLSIKEEEEEVKSEYKYSQLVKNINAKAKTKRNMSERESSKNSNNVLSVSQVKSEEKLDTKSLLQASQSRGGTHITQDQIDQLIKYIVSDKLSVAASSIKVNISIYTAHKYYNMYKNDPEQRIPEPRKRNINNNIPPTYEQIKALINHIEICKMSIAEASRRTNISVATRHKYYHMYKDDPEQKIPKPPNQTLRNKKYLTYEQIKTLVNHIEIDGLSVSVASRRTNTSRATGCKYYNMYKNDPERKIPQPQKLRFKNIKPFTYNRIKELISYIVNDNMSIAEASKKVNISTTTGRKYYKMYMEDPERKTPKPTRKKANTDKKYTQDQIKVLIDYVEKDELSLIAASRKLDISINTARKYYLKYLSDPNHGIPTPGKRGTHSGKHYTQDQVKELIHYIVNDKMTMQAASIKANMGLSTAKKYYRKYLDDLETQNSVNINKNLIVKPPQE